jgi:hypothetical protein
MGMRDVPIYCAHLAIEATRSFGESLMALPSRDQTFAFADCRELLNKLEREIDRYREVVGRDENEPEALMKLVDQLKDSAFNAAVTAWHLCDWVFNDMTLEQRQNSISRS